MKPSQKCFSYVPSIYIFHFVSDTKPGYLKIQLFCMPHYFASSASNDREINLKMAGNDQIFPCQEGSCTTACYQLSAVIYCLSKK